MDLSHALSKRWHPLVLHLLVFNRKHQIPTSMEQNFIQTSKFFLPFYTITLGKKDHPISSSQVFKVVKTVIWIKVGISIRPPQHYVIKIEGLQTTWLNLTRHRYRKSASQEKNIRRFTDKFDDLFDIAHDNGTSAISKEDQDFLQAQREPGRQRIYRIRGLR